MGPKGLYEEIVYNPDTVWGTRNVDVVEEGV